jgi:2-methylisocitrate lyase-like PEP mutase family enzyme
MASNYATFAAVHVPGDPVILYNIWDVGSALAVVAGGAEALATGSHPVADANGFPDGQKVPIDFAFANARRIVEAVEVPLTVDFEGAYSTDPQEGGANVARLKETGAVGCNFEDQVIGGEGVHPLDLQVKRIAAIRSAVGSDFFINARTDLFLKTQTYDDALVDQVIERGKAFADAGASGFFVPRLAEPAQIERIVRGVSLPLNVIALPGAPDKREWLAAGVARISHGPFPHRALMATLTEMAKAAIG